MAEAKIRSIEKSSTNKMVKVKFNVNTAIVLNKDEIVIYNDDAKIRANQFFNHKAYKVVKRGDVHEISEAQYLEQFEGKSVRIPSGRQGNLSKELTSLKMQLKDRFDPKMEKDFVLNHTLPVCEIIQ